jgi:ABC-2 type transport system ATP-binding protein
MSIMSPERYRPRAMPAVEVESLTVRYGAVTAVDGVSFAAEAGEVLALLGPNGAGKTTTVETCLGYRRPAGGSVRVLGLDPSVGADRRELLLHTGVMLQEGGVYPGMAPVAAVRLFASYYGERAVRRPAALLERVGLADPRVQRTPWRSLSGGERQRLSLALALVGRPSVAFLDEPTAGVDPAGRLTIRDVVRSLRDDGTCVVLTTHDLAEAEKVADRVVIVDRGRVVGAGTPAELTSPAAASGGGVGAEVRFGAIPGLDVAALGSALGGVDVREDRAGEYVVRAEATPSLVAGVTAWLAERGVPLADLRAGRPSLEDVFLRLTSEKGDEER